ncbi:immunity 49 family protein [uncultured Kordia sp.]|uniref:immunity 49 family protein n=1 Tax=uncultured Kordia sp. TaxID=507699 RepID=UPI00260DCCE0|nr:immunity 49 family protein [uncultured Kordia sp.]
MGNKIDFKNWDQEIFEYKLSKNFTGFKEKFIGVVQGNATRLHNLFIRNRLWFTLKYIEDKTSIEELKNYFRHAMQSIYGHIITEEHIGESQEIWVADKKVQLKKERRGSDTSIDTLINFFNFASICRCEKAIEAIFRQDGTGPFLDNPNSVKSYYYEYFFLERSLHKIDESIIKRELDIGNKKAEKFYEGEDEWKDWYQGIYIPLSELKYAFFLGDETSFNEKLQIALDKDRAFSDDSKGRCSNSDYWIPWDIIALACRAHDKGWKITVEDSRLLTFLIEGKCNVSNLEP